MALKIPRKVPRYKLNIKGVPWTIYIVTGKQFRKLHSDLLDAETPIPHGMTDPNNHVICLCSDYPAPVACQTLLHELVHAWVADLEAAKIPEHDDAISEELVAEAVSVGMLEVLSHINLLMDFVKKHIKDVEDIDDDE